MTEQLSPAAQAVLDAFLHAMCNNKFSPAAVLRAAADQVIEDVSPVESILAIAAELEQSN